MKLSSPFLGALAQLLKVTIMFVMFCLSVCQHETARLSLDGFARNLTFEDFWKSCRENSSLIKIRKIAGILHEALCTLMIISRWILLRMSIIPDKVVEKIKTHIVCSITFFRKSCPLWDNVEDNVTARQATDDNIILNMRLACGITKAADTHS
jgi:hypothetical protein